MAVVMSTLDARAAELLKTIDQHFGDTWFSRSDLAKALDKSQLREGEILVMDYLVKEGKVEAEQTTVLNTIKVKWIYRLVK
jgi:hypothetical protein